MEFLVNANRKIIRLICTIFTVACMLGVNADLSIAMSVKKCAKLRGNISRLRHNVDIARDNYMELAWELARARGDDALYNSLKKQIIQFGDELYKEIKKIDAWEEKYDAGCRPPD